VISEIRLDLFTDNTVSEMNREI